MFKYIYVSFIVLKKTHNSSMLTNISSTCMFTDVKAKKKTKFIKI